MQQPNALQFESSPYLLQHKDQPVNWFAWNKEVLEKAKRDNKLIIVSIGYSTCHWCHVMAHESFENKDIAGIMNQHFINIKIDREERPDLDQYFMHAVQKMGVQGGWPLHVFLTPDAKVFYGGTYFPSVKKYGRISWPELLQYIATHFKSNPTELISQANAFEQQLLKTVPATQDEENVLSKIDFGIVEDQIQKYFDIDNGGFGFAPKFPQSLVLDFIFKSAYSFKANKLMHHAQFSLERMCFSGLYDHVGGGFFRYCVDSIWAIPHFEKMLYDQALILQNLAFLLNEENENSIVKTFVDNTIIFLDREMKDPHSGLYYAAINADSEGEEGKFYLWNEDEIAANEKNKENIITQFFEWHVAEMGSSKHLVPQWKKFVAETNRKENYDNCSSAVKELFLEREKRVRPSTDEKQILSWNALLLISFCELFENGSEEVFKEKAIELIASIEQYFPVQRHAHIYCRYIINQQQKGNSFFEDYVYLSYAYIKLYSCSLDKKYLNASLDIFKEIEHQFTKKDGLFLMSGKYHTDSLTGMNEWQDSSLPNANAMYAELNRIFYLLLSDEKYNIDFIEYVQNLPKKLLDYPLGLSTWLKTIHEYYHAGLVIKCATTAQQNKLRKEFPNRSILFHVKDWGNPEEVEICEGNICSLKRI